MYRYAFSGRLSGRVGTQSTLEVLSRRSQKVGIGRKIPFPIQAVISRNFYDSQLPITWRHQLLLFILNSDLSHIAKFGQYMNRMSVIKSYYHSDPNQHSNFIYYLPFLYTLLLFCKLQSYNMNWQSYDPFIFKIFNSNLIILSNCSFHFLSFSLFYTL